MIRQHEDIYIYPSLIVDPLTALGDGFPVGFHVALSKLMVGHHIPELVRTYLLEIVGKLVEILVIRKQSVGLGACYIFLIRDKPQ